jgi:uncharacterized delta-60 repeat protein
MKSKQSWVTIGLIITLIISSGAALAADGALDPNFNFGVGVQKIPIIRGQVDYQDSNGNFNGNSLIFGYFTSLTSGGNTYNLNSIAKLTDSSGTVDTTLNIPVNGEIRNVFLSNPKSPTSDIILGGNFSVTSGGTTYYNLARLTWNGMAYAVDTTFPQIFNQVATGEGISVSAVNTIAKQGSTGTFLVGGYNLQVLASAGGDTSKAYHLIHLNSNWTYDSVYSTANPARALPGGNVNSINLSDPNFPNQARIFGTLPKAAGGTDWMELTGTNLFTIVQGLGSGQLDGPIFGMALTQTNGPWVIWGNFKTAFSTTINRVALLNNSLTDLDNSTDPYASFNSGIISGGGANHTVQHAVPQFPNGIILGGNLTVFNGTTCGHLVRIKNDGTVDSTFNAGGSGLDDRPFKVYPPNGNPNLQVLGAFRNYDDNPRGGIARIDPNNGTLLSNYTGVSANSTTPGTVISLEGTWQGDGSIIIGGDFTGVGGKWHQNLAKINWDGSTDHSFISNVDGVVNSLRSRDDKMLVAGQFGTVNGVGCTSLARLGNDYSLDNSFNPVVIKADGTLASIRMLDTDDSGLTIIGGHFDSINGSASTAVARLLSTGALDPSFMFYPSEFPDLTKIKVNAGGNMGGMYPIAGKATYSGSTRGFACRLLNNGQLDTSFAIGQSPVAHVALFDGEVINGGALPDGRIFLCGNFTHVNNGNSFSIPRGYIARFTANGTLDSAWAPVGANGTIYSLDIQPNGKILIGGLFTQYNSVGRKAFTRLNPDGSLDTYFNAGGSGPNGPVIVASRWGNPQAYIGGGFTSYNGTPIGSLARIINHGTVNLTPILMQLLNDSP